MYTDFQVLLLCIMPQKVSVFLSFFHALFVIRLTFELEENVVIH